ncbi:hypothetical protein AWR36_005485 [Microbulbifer flavimaris]|uniref:APCDD1 domain-containing protein n=1 Tax=Microbulbifer flavimaris TaxID=1781068 RepID=A0ABX4HZC6_9GAMM|nr:MULTISPECIES: hypothetical protein [Microbulbifer]KUJ83321.1 hypothetical protein AVO43_05475 [Microbulbifer sp. ZGT114]PCO05474.1 hypothetical protein AWR36_005485 [Microbulbifer flavimaris]
MYKLIAIAVASLLATGTVHAKSLSNQLVGQWQSQCKKASGRYLQVISRFTEAGEYRATSNFYTDSACSAPMGMEIVSTGRYRLGALFTTAAGESAQEIDLDVGELRSGGMTLPGAGERVHQIISIIDGRLVFGDAPGLPAVTGGQRPTKLNKNFYSNKQ